MDPPFGSNIVGVVALSIKITQRKKPPPPLHHPKERIYEELKSVHQFYFWRDSDLFFWHNSN